MPMPALWQLTPLGIVAVVAGLAYEIGLRRLAKVQNEAHRRRFRKRSLAFYGGLLGLILVISGPLERWSMQWLSIHMTVHVLEMFYLPPLLIVGAPWVPIVFCLPTDRRRQILRWYYRSHSLGWLRVMANFAKRPLVAIVFFNTVMVVWHLPVVFDWASWHDWSMEWLMAPSFVVAGYLFWRIILPSGPYGPRGSTRMQLVAIAVTAFEMLVLAMAMAIFTKSPWYSMNVLMNGSAAALRDQRWAAGILWVCGDFWAVPGIVLVAYRLNLTEGGVSASFERALGRA
jgi:cytochrome c oxidase assembly factor CtaG